MADRDGPARGPGATGARQADLGGRGVLPWILGAVVLAALLIGGLWYFTEGDDELFDDDLQDPPTTIVDDDLD